MQPPSKGLSLLLHGSSFPSSDPSSIRHSLNLTLLCNPSEESPKFVGFDRLRGVVDIEWSVPAACPSSKDGSHDQDGGNPPDKEDPSVPAAGGGVGWFFIMILLAVIGYFGLGAYYNYNNYGSTGWDLVPHRDFWREVPYLIEDLASYMFSSVRSGGGSRGGYVSV